jgi:hypothetical protein
MISVMTPYGGVDMALAMRNVQLFFPFENFVHGEGQPGALTVVFENENVRDAQAVLKGFDIEYQGPADHHILREQITISSEVQPDGVHVGVHMLLRDGSGNIDDPFGGVVEVVIIADVG